MDIVTTEKFNQYVTIQIAYDPDGPNPRVDYDNVGTMVCWHSRYTLGDEQPDCSPEQYRIEMATRALSNCGKECGWSKLAAMYRKAGESWDDAYSMMDYDLEDRIDNNPAKLHAILEKHYIVLPLYLYDHSGITMNTGGFSCAWDSGCVGFIYCTKADAIREWGKKICTAKVREAAINYLKGEVQDYDNHLTGQCYGYVIETDQDDLEESCWGYLGDENYCLEDARHAAKWVWKERRNRLITEFIESRRQCFLKQFEFKKVMEAIETIKQALSPEGLKL